MSEITTGWSLLALERRGQIRLAKDGKTPLPFVEKEELNSAPVDDRTHEFVMTESNAGER